MSKRKRFTAKAQVKVLTGISMELPDEIPIPSEYEKSDSVAILICPMCGAKRYVSQKFLDLLKELEGIHEAIEQALPRHKPCQTIMHLRYLEPE